jgi:chemotaxis regulatin CheY-phosphate phosphatase CheZ
MKIDEILTLWEADCDIDENHLDNASMSTAKLHSKYLKFLIDSKLRKTKLDIDYNTMKKTKIRYYRGEMGREELKELGWEQYQYLKPMKNEMEEFLKGDEDLTKILLRQDYMEASIYAIESIMSQIKQRDWQIRNAITFKQFIAGN